MSICTMLFLTVFHLSELFTYPNKMFVAFDQWGSDNRGFTVVPLIYMFSYLVFWRNSRSCAGLRGYGAMSEREIATTDSNLDSH